MSVGPLLRVWARYAFYAFAFFHATGADAPAAPAPENAGVSAQSRQPLPVSEPNLADLWAGIDPARPKEAVDSAKPKPTVGAAANAILAQLAKSDREQGRSVLPISVTDTRGASLCSAESAWIVKRPELTYGRDAGSVEWVLDCAQLSIEPGELFFNALP